MTRENRKMDMASGKTSSDASGDSVLIEQKLLRDDEQRLRVEPSSGAEAQSFETLVGLLFVAVVPPAIGEGSGVEHVCHGVYLIQRAG